MDKQVWFLFLFFAFFTVDIIQAQNSKLDSIENLLKIHQASDTVKVNLLNEIAYAVYSDDPVKTRNYALKAGELSDSLKFLKGKAESLWLIGTSYGKTNQALLFEYTQKSLNIAETINYKSGIAKCYNALLSFTDFRVIMPRRLSIIIKP